MKPKLKTERGRKVYVLDARARGFGRLYGETADECWQKFNEKAAGLDDIKFTDEDKQAKRELGERGTLLEAVRCLLAQKPVSKALTLTAAGEAWEAEAKRLNITGGFISTGRIALNHFKTYCGADTLVNNITSEQIKHFLSSKPTWSVGYRNTLRGRLVHFFTYCVDHGVCASHPIKDKRVKSVREDREQRKDPPRIFTVDECKKLLETAQTHFPRLLPYLALGIFCGVRPDQKSEMGRITPADIHLEAGEVDVFGKNGQRSVRLIQTIKSKVQQPDGAIVETAVQLAPALAWLKAAPGLEIVWNRYQRRALCKKSGVRWSPDVMRHTFASYHYYGFKNATDTAEQMGHDQSMKMLKKHYLNRAAERTAADFWRLMPTPVVTVVPDQKPGKVLNEDLKMVV